jgi:hypothetical protein
MHVQGMVPCKACALPGRSWARAAMRAAAHTHLRSAVESCTRMAIVSGSAVPNSRSSPRGSRTARARYALPAAHAAAHRRGATSRSMLLGMPTRREAALDTSHVSSQHTRSTAPLRITTCCGRTADSCPALRWGSMSTACTPPGCVCARCSRPPSARCPSWPAAALRLLQPRLPLGAPALTPGPLLPQAWA